MSTIMVDVIGIALILGGLVLLLGGAALSIYGVALLGAVIGGGLGYIGGPMIANLVGFNETIGIVIGLIVGGLVGIIIAYAILRWAIAILGLVIGGYYGAVVIVPAFTDLGTYSTWAVGIVLGLITSALALVFAKSILIVLTSLAGATLVSGSVTFDDLIEAGEATALEPLGFDVADPIFLVLLVIGLAFQFGIFRFGYVTAIVAKLPGASVITNRGEKT